MIPPYQMYLGFLFSSGFFYRLGCILKYLEWFFFSGHEHRYKRNHNY